jgi:hypothetical protein
MEKYYELCRLFPNIRSLVFIQFSRALPSHFFDFTQLFIGQKYYSSPVNVLHNKCPKLQEEYIHHTMIELRTVAL